MMKTNWTHWLLLLAFNFSFPNGAYTHAVVTKHSLNIAPVQSGKTSTIELMFNSNIELGLSKFYLVKADDQHESLTFTAGNKPGQVVIQLPDLEPGKYALRFKIFATDGHLSEDLIRFTVTP